MTINQIPKLNLLMPMIASILIFLYLSIINNSEDFAFNDFKYYSVYAQINSFNENSTTILGDVKIPSNSNDTMTTAMDTASNNTIPTAINKTLIAQNATSAINILKENSTTPISPTGISTQGLHQPPQHRLVNNTDSTSTISNINNANQSANQTGEATQGNASKGGAESSEGAKNLGINITEGAKGLAETIGKGLENLGK
jgi:hypothetical protein